MLFNWFKKKDKLIPLDSAEPGKGKEQTRSGHAPRKPLARLPAPAQGVPVPGAPKTASQTGDTSRIKTSESAVIRIGKLGEVLLQYNMVSRENLEKALALQQQQPSGLPAPGEARQAGPVRKRLGEILIENNFITEEQLLSAFARHCRIPYIKINKYGLPKAAIQAVPADLVLKHKVLPVDKVGTVLMLAVTDPYDTAAVDEVKAKTNLRIKTILCKQSEFWEMVKFYYPNAQAQAGAASPSESEAGEKPTESVPEPVPQAAPVETTAPPEQATNTDRTGEETSIFKIEELPFPEPPVLTSADSKPAPAKEPAPDEGSAPPQAIEARIEAPEPPVPPPPIAEKPTPQAVPAQPQEKSVSEEFLGGTIEQETPRTTLWSNGAPAIVDKSGAVQKEEAKPIPAQEVVEDKSTAPVQETPAAVQPPDTSGINGYDTSLIDIRELLSTQATSEDENIEIIPEQPQPIDVVPYIYPEEEKANETPAPPAEIPVAVSQKESPEQAAPKPDAVADAPARAAEAEKPRAPAGRETSVRNDPEPKAVPPNLPADKDALIIVSEDEFIVAQQLFDRQSRPWENFHHRGRPSQAEKVGEPEFALYTESAIK
ncbi:MAG: hypothetical protein AB1599_00875 [Planctomycetota bacterium]